MPPGRAPRPSAEIPKPNAEFEKAMLAELPFLEKLAYYFVRGDKARQNDLVQQTIEKALRSNATFVRTGENSMKRWLSTIMRNEHIAYFSSRAHKNDSVVEIVEDIVSDEDTPNQDIILEYKDLLEKVLDTIAEKLTDDHRLVLECLIAGNSYSDIADMLGIELNTVKSRISRAREALSKALGKKFAISLDEILDR